MHFTFTVMPSGSTSPSDKHGDRKTQPLMVGGRGAAWKEGHILDPSGILLRVSIPEACENML